MIKRRKNHSWHSPKSPLLGIVSEIVSAEILILILAIVELNPIGIIEIFILKTVLVASDKFIDD